MDNRRRRNKNLSQNYYQCMVKLTKRSYDPEQPELIKFLFSQSGRRTSKRGEQSEVGKSSGVSLSWSWTCCRDWKRMEVSAFASSRSRYEVESKVARATFRLDFFVGVIAYKLKLDH